MELKSYIRILLKKWWIVIPVAIVTFVATQLFTLRQPLIFETEASYIMKPRRELFPDEQEAVRVVDTMSRHVSIGTTYAEVATSKLINSRVQAKLGLAPDQRADLSVDSQMVAGTNILHITVSGTDPDLLPNYANQIGHETVDYVSSLYDVFELALLDQAVRPTRPIKPNVPLNLTLGGILGLFLGAGLAFFVTYIAAPPEQIPAFDIVEQQTGAYNESYYRLRLRQEMSRARQTKHSFALVLFKIATSNDTGFDAEILRRITIILESELRDEDVLAYVGDATFAFLLPSMSSRSAHTLAEELRVKLSTSTFVRSDGALKQNIRGYAGIVAYPDNGTTENDLWSHAAVSLERVTRSTYQRIGRLPLTRGSRERVYSERVS